MKFSLINDLDINSNSTNIKMSVFTGRYITHFYTLNYLIQNFATWGFPIDIVLEKQYTI